ncbi:hypothetical protein PAERUG_P45_London_17_VIM_2_12_12_04076 [Pseudomonas aeruginosa]|nr:hypothetical protein PAERUG_E16_London_17_VIM_2_04_14_04538 [Pseudomonas aeruginosa]CRR40254.1 hypothetical protein PAERUG_P45_London_17_VIM_2_12_12_04076 [Pseudomonas aeruginosa]
MFSITLSSCCQGSTIARAICSARSIPFTFPSWSRLLARAPVSFSRVTIIRAASPPNAPVIASRSLCLVNWPNFTCSLSRICMMGSSRPPASVNFMPSLSWAALTFSKNAL